MQVSFQFLNIMSKMIKHYGVNNTSYDKKIVGMKRNS